MGRTPQRRRPGRRPVRALLALALGLACSAPDEPGSAVASPEPDTATVVVAGESFEVEVAADLVTRTRGLSGRTAIPRNGGMLFVLPRPEPFTMVMRDCPNPIDVAFIDAMGRVVAIHEMWPEPPRRPDESPFRYEMRLPGYSSREPVQFALETAGGRLAELHVQVGDRLHFSARELIARAQELERSSRNPGP
jgi:uncharacterized membrane protein (UPF0127 family)